MESLTDDVIQTIKLAAKLLTAYKRRQFQAEMALKYCNGSARTTEATFGWGRVAAETGLNEKRTGIRCLDACSLRGRKKSEERCPQLETHVHRLVEPRAQAISSPFLKRRELVGVLHPAHHSARIGMACQTERTLVRHAIAIRVSRVGY
jgi:hypothetical protein